MVGKGSDNSVPHRGRIELQTGVILCVICLGEGGRFRP
jgi:hypothetical protein